MLQEILKQATKLQHDQLEQLMFVDKIMNGSLSFSEYKQILLTNYLVHADLEKHLHTGIDSALQQKLQVDKRAKLAALKQDLLELDIGLPKKNLYKNSIPILQNNAAILGAMYVLEGATLGGNVIVKKLKTNLNLQNRQLNFHYYQVYGEDLIARWKQFCQVLNTEIDTADHETCIQSALNIFACFAVAMRQIPKSKSFAQV